MNQYMSRGRPGTATARARTPAPGTAGEPPGGVPQVLRHVLQQLIVTSVSLSQWRCILSS